MRSLAALWLLTACTFEPASGQFGCADGVCPDGLVCVEARCVRASDAALPDAGRDGGADPDAGVDGSVPEDAGPEDAGPEDAGPGDAGAPCPADFCADFEEPSVLAGWTIPEVVGTGAVERRTEADAPSPPGVFHSSISVPPPNATYHAARLSLQETVPGYDVATPQLELSFSFRMDELVDNPGVTLAGLRYGADEHYVIVAINPHPTDATRVEVNYFFAPESVVRPIGDVALGEWASLDIRVARRVSASGTPVGGGVTFVLGDAVVTGFLPEAALTDALRFDVGLATTNSDARRAAASYDAVVIRYR